MSRTSKPPIAVYSALADATRCRIIEILLAGPIPVHTLADEFSISRPAISRHLRVLKTAGLVAEVKKGRENLYALRTAKLGPATAWIEKIVAPAAAKDPAEKAAPAASATASAPDNSLSISGKPVAVRRRVEVTDSVVTPAVAPLAQPKADKAPRAPKSEVPTSQMGFDF